MTNDVGVRDGDATTIIGGHLVLGWLKCVYCRRRSDTSTNNQSAHFTHLFFDKHTHTYIILRFVCGENTNIHPKFKIRRATHIPLEIDPVAAANLILLFLVSSVAVEKMSRNLHCPASKGSGGYMHLETQGVRINPHSSGTLCILLIVAIIWVVDQILIGCVW